MKLLNISLLHTVVPALPNQAWITGLPDDLMSKAKSRHSGDYNNENRNDTKHIQIRGANVSHPLEQPARINLQ